MFAILNGDLNSLSNFSDRQNKLEILLRHKPAEASLFFKKLLRTPFHSEGEITRHNALADITDAMNKVIPHEIRHETFFGVWVHDMAEVAKLFCTIENSDRIRFWVGTNRGCSRYHIDHVPRRLLVTYEGKGTEWLPDDAADRIAHARGEPNEAILKNPSARRFIDEWDVAVFRGGSAGLLHRTPDEALTSPTLFMRLDNKEFGCN